MMQLEGDFFITAIQKLSPEYIYVAAGELAYWVLGSLTMPILFFALVWRARGEVLGAVTGKGAMWLSILSQFFAWSVVLVLYFAICQVVFEGFNVLYSFSEALGGHQAMMTKFSEYYELALAKTEQEDGLMDQVLNFASIPVTGFLILIYNLTMVVYVAFHILIRWAQALGFATAFYWGLIAIPLYLMSDNNKKLLQNWHILFSTMLIWPCIDGTTQWLVSHGFLSMFEEMTVLTQNSNDAHIDLTSVYSLFSLLNIILTLTTFVAFGITVGLLVSGSISSLNAMAAGGAIAVGGLAVASMSKSMPWVGKGVAKGSVGSFKLARSAPSKLAEGAGAIKRVGGRISQHRQRVQESGSSVNVSPNPALKESNSSSSNPSSNQSTQSQKDVETTATPKKNPIKTTAKAATAKATSSVKQASHADGSSGAESSAEGAPKKYKRKPMTEKQKRDRRNAIIKQVKARQES